MKEKGFSLIEIMVSCFIFAIGCLSLAGMQSVAVKSLIEVEQRALADSLLVDITERMQMNRAWLSNSANNYIVSSVQDDTSVQPDCAKKGALSDCAGEDIKANDLFEWKNKLLTAHVAGSTQGLINADACILDDGNGIGIVDITITWQEQAEPSKIKACGIKSSDRRQVTTKYYIGNS
ncbi:type IV pilus modification protein PilV [Psychromonas ossibalaenae]|uniref:type IV pilus modification protein PilV n=1 Tax=Psychromonas ossibalaenae TaxID=444922 RepID=UPI000362E286|nr:type IV pilus modification protein PilV [Psychromonas ossibalaenae]